MSRRGRIPKNIRAAKQRQQWARVDRSRHLNRTRPELHVFDVVTYPASELPADSKLLPSRDEGKAPPD